MGMMSQAAEMHICPWEHIYSPTEESSVRGNISIGDLLLIIGMPERFRCLNVDLSGVSGVS